MSSSALRHAAGFGCFAASLLSLCWVARGLVPWPDDLGPGPRFEWLVGHVDEFDLIYFGSSHVYHSFVPRVIDEELARHGQRIRSFNLAAQGMSVFEMDFLIREVLSLEPKRLRWVVFEYGFYAFENPDRISAPFNYYSDRAVFWHTPARSWDVLRAVAHSDLAFGHRAELAWTHLRHALWRFASIGQGPRIAAALSGRSDGRDPPDFERSAGYLPLERDPMPATRQNRADFIADPEAYLAGLDAIDSSNELQVEIDRLELEPLQSLQAAIRRAGAEPIVVVTAFPYATPAHYALARSGVIRLIAMNSPSRYADLYRPDRRFDGLHLNERGAIEFSRLFGLRLARTIGGESGP